MSDTQRERESSQHWNEDLLTSLGFRRVANTTIFRDANGVTLLSPGVGEGKLWFDIRQVNVDKLGDSLAGVVLRFVPDGFAVISLAEISPRITSATVRATKTGGPTYGFRCRIDSSTGMINLVASSSSAVTFATAMLDRGAAAEAIRSLVSRRPS